jgi:hypothetical protein
MSGIFIAINPDEGTFASMDKAFQDWTTRAARGECGWICADCCVSFDKGMPDACVHGHQSCTNIIQRDKREAQAEIATEKKGEQA